jgi:hypothetical protein
MFVRVRFKKSFVLIPGLLALAVVGFVAYFRHAQTLVQAEEAKRLVRAEELELMDIRLQPHSESFGSSYTLTGRVRNNSRYTVTDIYVKIRLFDCDEKEHCDVIGEQDHDIVTNIPAKQARDIQSVSYLDSGTHIRGRLKWSYSLNEISARSGFLR